MLENRRFDALPALTYPRNYPISAAPLLILLKKFIRQISLKLLPLLGAFAILFSVFYNPNRPTVFPDIMVRNQKMESKYERNRI